jgi:hypothetical protein
LPLAQNYIENAACRFTSNNPVGQNYEGVENRRPGVRNESMLRSFFFASSAALSSVDPGHRDSNLEAVGMTMVCCPHQAVPSRFQVIVPVRGIWDKGTVVRDGDPGASMEPR